MVEFNTEEATIHFLRFAIWNKQFLLNITAEVTNKIKTTELRIEVRQREPVCPSKVRHLIQSNGNTPELLCVSFTLEASQCNFMPRLSNAAKWEGIKKRR